MAKTRGEARTARLRQMEEKYRLRAYTDQEMADELQVRRETVYDDRLALEADGAEFDQIERGRYKIKNASFLSQIRLNPLQSLPLYLFARKSARQMGLAQPYVVQGIEKLALCLRQPMAQRLAQAAQRLALNPQAEQQVKVFEQIAEGWIEGRQVDIHYVRLGGTREVRHTVNPYLIEPSVWSDAIYVIGWAEPDKRVMPFKLDRMTYAFARSERFELPQEFDEQALLQQAWGVWTASGEAQWVRLRFVDRVAIQRMKETRWHPLQSEPQDQTDGTCIWSAPVAEWREMLPWVRGWGSSVEALEPEEMRRELMMEVRRIGRVYGLGATQSQDPQLARLLRCWGKTAAQERFHPALYHMMDVGHVAQVLLGEEASPRWRNVLAQAFGWPVTLVQQWVPFWVALHDLGKVSVSFAGLNAAQKLRLQREGFSFGKWTQASDAPHGLIGQAVLRQVFVTDSLVHSSDLLRLLEEMIGGHHGTFADSQKLRQFRQRLKAGEEPAEWAELRQVAFQNLREVFAPPQIETLPAVRHYSAALAALTGFTILCDWLGSDSRYFIAQQDADFEDYRLDSQRRADTVTTSVGLMQGVSSIAPTPVQQLFPHLQPPRPLQIAIDAIPDELLRQPCLAIIEAPTGEGKTEAAQALSHRIAQAQGSDELYCALPTMATSNQMFARMQHYLREQLHLDAHIALVHGQAFLIEDEMRIKPMDNGDGETQTEAIEWFSSKKRALLAPFGVGTVDQAELATLNVRHNMLRLIGLAGKVIILDEVHAYDTYMSGIIQRLLEWLSVLGTSVILLSATLPTKQRRALAQAYGVTALEALPDAYPSLIVAVRDQLPHVQCPQAWQPNRQLDVAAMFFEENDSADEVAQKAEWLIEAIQDGGCACWICNTVNRAQRLFAALQAHPHLGGAALTLLHARFPLDQRQGIEQALAQAYGRTGARPVRGIVIGTQVLEQSLDLDFDVMVSDLAPIDFVLQRAGRLHRHARERPEQHTHPRLWIYTPLQRDPTNKLGADVRIYDEYLLRRTWQALALPRVLRLPQDYRPLVEAVYSGQPVPEEVLFPAWQRLQDKQAKDAQEAQLRLLPTPDAEDSFVPAIGQLTFDEDENSAAWKVAQTRLGEESLNIIPMTLLDGEMAQVILESGEQVVVALNRSAENDVLLKLLRRNMRISNYEAIQGIRAAWQAQPHRLFADEALLKGYYPLLLRDGQAQFAAKQGVLTLCLHPQLGLVIEKKGVDA